MSASASEPTAAEACVRRRDDGPVRILELSNPARRNAFTLASMAALEAELDDGMRDPGVGAFVVTGAGDTFCAGIEVSVLRDATVESTHTNLEALHRVVRAVVAGSKPVVAAVEGHAVGAGFSLALAADLVVASATASFRCGFPRLGLMADLGLLWTLPQRVGAGLTRRMLLLDEEVQAAEALRSGLADFPAAAGAALAVATQVAQQLAAQPRLATAMTKKVLAQGSTSLDALLAAEIGAQTMLHATTDFHEGVAAFTEKRPPRFGD